jgi:pimeloyl-[acyl-carrier protein] synthase
MVGSAALKHEDATLSLYQLLDPERLANPYPLYKRLREQAHVQWDPYLHSWVVTGYEDVVTVLLHFSADRTATPEQLAKLGLSDLAPIAAVMTKQMLFMDVPAHTRLRTLASQAFTTSRVEKLRYKIQEIIDRLLDEADRGGSLEIIADLAEPLPAIVTAELLGVGVHDHRKLKSWSAAFAEVLGNFQHNPERSVAVLNNLEEMIAYFKQAVRQDDAPDGLIHNLLIARDNDDRLSEDEVIANIIVTMVGGQETTTNLIGNGLLALLRNPNELERLRCNLELLPSAVEELLRFEPPSQHTARIAHQDIVLGGQSIRKGDSVMAVMAAANRDPLRFPDPDRLDLARTDNRHLAFGWGRHFCFGAPLARLEGRMVFETLLRRYPKIELLPGTLTWRQNLGLRGLDRLPVSVA